MLVATQLDGSVITYEEAASQFFRADSPVTACEVQQLGATGNLRWVSDEIRDWVGGVADWERAGTESRTERVVAVDAALEFDGESIRINREIAKIRSTVGKRPSLQFPVGAVFDIQTRPPTTMVSGYLRFVLYGHPGGPLEGPLKLGLSPYAVAFRNGQSQEIYDLRDRILSTAQERLASGEPPVTVPTPDELSTPQSVTSAITSTGAAAAPGSSQMVCPHCGKRGTVKTKKVTRKAGVSGGKATAAVLTGGLSLLATGLSRKENLTQAQCSNCKNTWHF